MTSSSAPPKPYQVTVSIRFVVLTIFTSWLLSFAVGRATRVILRTEGGLAAVLEKTSFHAPVQDDANVDDWYEGSSSMKVPLHNKIKRPLPAPVLMDGKEMPRTVYTSKNFDTASSTASSLLIHKNDTSTTSLLDKARYKDAEGHWHETTTSSSCGAEDGTCSRGKGGGGTPLEFEPSEEEEEHLPAGQHLLVDMKDVDPTFLDSEERLAQAMVDVVVDSQLTLLSYHCHVLVPSGVSCAGVLLESHVSFHTWPEEGVITLDLFTCGSAPLLPVVPIIAAKFGLPEPGSEQQPSILWSHKLRGFRTLSKRPGHLQSQDLGRNVLGVMDFDVKKEVASAETKFQRIDIYDLIYPRFSDLGSYLQSQSNDGSYQSEHPELFLPDRQIFLDGVLQSTRLGDEAYHEGLVHPAMLSHPFPKRVAIIGGGEGASLREVLKHGTVEKVVMIEIDEIMVDVSKQFIPSWNSCADIVGSTPSCFDDPRAATYYEDALAWFIDRFGPAKKLDGEEPFDVIIMDALDPQDNVEFADALYNNDVFVKALFAGLSPQGILGMQLGASPNFDDPAERFSHDKNRAVIIEHMEQVGFQSFHMYEDFHSQFQDPWSTLVSCKHVRCRTNWFDRTPAVVELELHRRLLPSQSGKPALQYFDGATMAAYQIPHKIFETMYCRIDPTPYSCLALGGGDEPLPVYGAEIFDLEVRSSVVAKGGLGLFAKHDIPKNSRVHWGDSKVVFGVETVDLLQDLQQPSRTTVEPVVEYMEFYGEETDHLGEVQIIVDSSRALFANHGCDGSHNLVRSFNSTGAGAFAREELNESDMDRANRALSSSREDHYRGYLYNPVIDRKLVTYLSECYTARQDIPAGTEVTVNYMSYIAERETWTDSVKAMNRLCQTGSF